jgi:hypothetical protein
MADIVLRTSARVPVNVHVGFLQMMINRLIVGYHRYEQHTGPERRNYLRRIGDKLADYRRTGNRELLVDVANYCMREFEFPSIPETYFGADDSRGKNRKD